MIRLALPDDRQKMRLGARTIQRNSRSGVLGLARDECGEGILQSEMVTHKESGVTRILKVDPKNIR